MIKKRTKRKLHTTKHKNKFNPSLLALALLIVIVGTLMVIFIQKDKRYDPALEKKLDMKTIPLEVKDSLKHASPSATYRVPVLMYHYVEIVTDKRDTIRQSLAINPYIFEQQIITLKSGNYTFMTAGELGGVLDGNKQLPPKPILLTFDDGYRDFYTDVFPILKKYNVKATSYIVPGFLGGRNWMEPDQVWEVANSGIVEIGAHTIHHSYLKKLDLKTVQKEVNTSKIMLQDEFNIPVVSFAYPYGAFDLQAIDVVKNAGFSTAMSTLPGINVNQADRYFIQRIRPGARIGEALINFLNNYQQPIQTSTDTKD